MGAVDGSSGRTMNEWNSRRSITARRKYTENSARSRDQRGLTGCSTVQMKAGPELFSRVLFITQNAKLHFYHEFFLHGQRFRFVKQSRNLIKRVIDPAATLVLLRR